MTPKNVRTAITEARRFITAAEAALDRQKRDDADTAEDFARRGLGAVGPSSTVGPSAESGAARRASLDLTRALAAMRRPS